LGSLAPPAPAGARQVAAEDDGFAIGAWLAGLLARAGVRPAHAAVFAEAPDAARLLRVEQPFADADGNLAVVLSNRASVPREILPAGGVLDISLPGGPWQSALWSPAETNALEAIPVRQVAADLHRLNLPEIRSAGILYFFRKHPPLLAARITGARQVAVDPHTAKIAPGEAVTLEIALHNTTGGKLPPGNLRVAAPAGWSVSPETLPTPEIAAGGSLSARATLVPLAGAPHKPDWLHPVVTHWRDASGADRAVFATHAEIALSENDTPLLLSDNAGYPDTFPRLLKTGATYAYVRPADARADPIDKSGGKNGAALQNGFGSEGGERNSLRRGAPLKKHYARYASRVVEIVFDLHAVRDVMRVNVVAGPEAVPLKSVEIHTAGEDGVFTRQAAAGLKAPLPEVVLHTGRVPARRVRIRAEWPAPGGTLDEIEIWGR
ncbi:MAG: alpha-galactosidase, partial [Opitutaceae bacterium]|nr:alpha-galactosidase [Opitutaceae bacterium]